WPVLADELEVAADPAGRDDDRLAAQFKYPDRFSRTRHTALLGCWFQQSAAHTLDRSVRHDQSIDTMPEPEPESSRMRGGACPAHEGSHHGRPRAPCDVNPRPRIAVPEAAVSTALRPAHNREPGHALLAKPGAHLSRSECDVGFGPFSRPVIFGPIE